MESPAIPKRSNEDLADGDADGGNAMEYPPAKRQKHAYSPHAAEKIVPVSRQPKALKSVLKGAANDRLRLQLRLLHAYTVSQTQPWAACLAEKWLACVGIVLIRLRAVPQRGRETFRGMLRSVHRARGSELRAAVADAAAAQRHRLRVHHGRPEAAHHDQRARGAAVSTKLRTVQGAVAEQQRAETQLAVAAFMITCSMALVTTDDALHDTPDRL